LATKNYFQYAACIVGIVAIGCVLSIGSYIVAWCWNIYSSDLIGPSFLLLAIISWVLVFASTIALVYGSVKILRKSALRGSLANTTAGTTMAILWLYFYYGFPLLTQFGFVTSLLFLPALFSALLGFASLRSQSVSPSMKENANRPQVESSE
jgi:hypothetical protein